MNVLSLVLRPPETNRCHFDLMWRRRFLWWGFSESIRRGAVEPCPPIIKASEGPECNAHPNRMGLHAQDRVPQDEGAHLSKATRKPRIPGRSGPDVAYLWGNGNSFALRVTVFGNFAKMRPLELSRARLGSAARRCTLSRAAAAQSQPRLSNRGKRPPCPPLD